MDKNENLVDEICSRLLPTITEKIDEAFDNATAPERPIGTKEAADFLEVSLSTLNRWTAERRVPFHQTTGDRGRLYFFKSEIVEFIKTGRVKTSKELGLDGEKFFNPEA
jgi:excisionase family DNA binding protein|tara:strand:- start:3458 stop:3784 length:327 start_codon:yes stop_codon:yes gene_type:complete